MSNISDLHFEKAAKLIPWGSSTCSKARSMPPYEPAAITSGSGCRIIDIEGREFIDYRNGLGPVTLGYAYKPFNDALSEQLAKGIVYGHPSVLEAEVAEMITQVIPCAEMVRFLKTGGEAVAAAIRLARSFTGRAHIIQIGYNGWLNSLASGGAILPSMTSAQSGKNGVPFALASLHHSAQWNNIKAVSDIIASLNGDVAAVVVAADYATITDGAKFYPQLRKLCDDNDIVLIYDEIVTGFRIAIGGVQEYFNVKPDLAVFSKGMANGMPISIFAGRRDVMQCCDKGGGTVISSTFAGDALSLAAAKFCIDTYRRENVVDYLWKTGKTLWDSVNDSFLKYGLNLEMKGFEPCKIITAIDPSKPSEQSSFIKNAYKHGVSLYNVSYINYSHSAKDISETIERLDLAAKDTAGEK